MLDFNRPDYCSIFDVVFPERLVLLTRLWDDLCRLNKHKSKNSFQGTFGSFLSWCVVASIKLKQWAALFSTTQSSLMRPGSSCLKFNTFNFKFKRNWSYVAKTCSFWVKNLFYLQNSALLNASTDSISFISVIRRSLIYLRENYNFSWHLRASISLIVSSNIYDTWNIIDSPSYFVYFPLFCVSFLYILLSNMSPDLYFLVTSVYGLFLHFLKNQWKK